MNQGLKSEWGLLGRSGEGMIQGAALPGSGCGESAEMAGREPPAPQATVRVHF